MTDWLRLENAAVDALGNFDDYLEVIESYLGPWRGTGTERFEVAGSEAAAQEALYEAVRKWARVWLRPIEEDE